ncbi:BACON domain-containing protein [Bacteroides sp.]|uniref:BACON domain-containing protein n=1 Tax=Bacteroides sp. TaxID=29523 RepID=UPI002A81C8A8|nr:BACON domain-containing protein [Bacteroides sp.]
MKYISKITLGLILCTALVTSCKDDDEPGIEGLALDKTEITMGAEGGVEKIAVSSSDQWVTSTKEPWLAISPANGIGSAVCEIAIDSTLQNLARTTEILFAMNGRTPQKVTVTQFGFSKQILIKESEVKIASSDRYDERVFKSTISTNVKFRIDGVDYSFAEEATMSEEQKADAESDRADWLTLPKEKDLNVELDRGARPRTIKVDFRWGMNVVPYTRVAKIRLIPEDPEDLKDLVDENGNKIDAVVLTVRQEAAMKIEDNRSGDSLAVITINNKLQSMTQIDASENMMNWANVTLWEATDKEIQNNELPEEAVGRVRSVSFAMINLQDGEALPKEIRHLKYIESFAVQSNENSQIRTISLGEEIGELQYLKHLTVYSVGINAFPDNFINLGNKLETLYLGNNNFPSLSVITNVVNQKNFGKLKALTLTGCRATDVLRDLSLISGGKYNGRDVGLHADVSKEYTEKEAFLKLLTWDKLISLEMSYNFLEGEFPTDEEVKNALTAAKKPLTYQQEDFFTKDELDATPAIYESKLSQDTCQWLLSTDNWVTYKDQDALRGQDILRVLPFARTLHLNLNFMTGKIPNWLLFHPYFAYWNPETMVFNQQEGGKNSSGDTVGFSNVELVNYDYSYYYGSEDPGTNQKVDGVAYPLYYKVFVLSDTVE